MFGQLAAHLSEREQSPFDFVVVDEGQDVSVAKLRFLAALGANRPNSLFSLAISDSGSFSSHSRGRR